MRSKQQHNILTDQLYFNLYRGDVYEFAAHLCTFFSLFAMDSVIYKIDILQKEHAKCVV